MTKKMALVLFILYVTTSLTVWIMYNTAVTEHEKLKACQQTFVKAGATLDEAKSECRL